MFPLQLHLLAHPDSKPSRRLAEAIMQRFMDPPASGGLRVPVWMTPDRGDGLPPQWDRDVRLDAAQHTVVVVLADSVSMQTVAGGPGLAWQAFYREGVARAPVGKSPHYMIGLAVGSNGLRLSNEHDVLSVGEPPWEDEVDGDYDAALQEWIDREIDGIALEITLCVIRLLDPRMEAAPDNPPLRLFLSHAKRDLSNDESHPLRAVQRAIRDLPVAGWFDAAEIPTSSEFADEIEKGLRDSSIVVSFLTDEYATRTWCQREVLDAKRLGVPILVVIALEQGEVRSFPYLGNAPTICCRPNDIDSIGKLIVYRSARETLRAVHNRACVAEIADEGEVALAAAPEAATLAYQNATRFIYPDPPLTEAEYALMKQLRPDAELLTPLMKLARRRRSTGKSVIAVSISGSGDLARHGLTKHHEKTLAEELHLYLLMAGLQIAYGGALRGDFSSASGNFTMMLFELVRSYAGLAKQAGVERLQPIVNYAPWPLRLGYGRQEYRLFQSDAELVAGPAPDPSEIPESVDDLFPQPADREEFRFKSDTVARRLAWTRGLTAMRAQMTEACLARLAIGGKLTGFSGIYPGIVEEAWMSLASGRPLYLVGTFGGAAAAVIDTLQGDASCLTDAMQNATDSQATLDLAKSRGMTEQQPGDSRVLYSVGQILHPHAMVSDITGRGKPGIASALNNGLSDEENQELFGSAHPPRIAELVLTGLARLRGN